MNWRLARGSSLWLGYQVMRRCRGNFNAYNSMKEGSVKGYILYDSNYMTFSKRQTYENGRKISDCSGRRKYTMLGRESLIKGSSHISTATVKEASAVNEVMPQK